ncbi:expressed unknown protein [Seminavis robusta]|uniref:Uncharacterized protein n=1 Tax=Seminavis robusta TaxID=568900 RepID=A0A9N8EPJ4_9STRA|nr:expressed unknown protein [Seminavis robusta]|eukprot:Sro1455_g274140.1 n/a (925) ;mRNA; r:11537-14311
MGCASSKAAIPQQTVPVEHTECTAPAEDVDVENQQQPLLSTTKGAATPAKRLGSSSPEALKEQRPKSRLPPNKSRIPPKRAQNSLPMSSEEAISISSSMIKPTKLHSAQSQEFTKHLETSLRARGLKQRVAKDVVSGVRNRTRQRGPSKRRAVLDYRQRVQITLQSDNASVHSKEVSTEVFNSSLRSIGMESTGHETAAATSTTQDQTNTAPNESTPRRRSRSKTGNSSSRSSSKQRQSRTSSSHHQSPAEKTRIPPNSSRSSKQRPTELPKIDVESAEPRPKRSGSVQRRKQSKRGSSSKSPSRSQRNKVDRIPDNQGASADVSSNEEGSQHTETPNNDKLDDTELDVSVVSTASSSQHVRRHQRKQSRKGSSKSPSTTRRTKTVDTSVNKKEGLPVGMSLAKESQHTAVPKLGASELLDASTSTNDTAHTSIREGSTSGSPNQRRRRTTLVTNQRPRERHDRMQDEKIVLSKYLASSIKTPDQKDSIAPSTSTKSRRHQQTRRKKTQPIMPENNPRISLGSKHGQGTDTSPQDGLDEAMPLSSSQATDTLVDIKTTSSRDSNGPFNASATLKPADEKSCNPSIEGPSQHSLGLPSQHSLGSYLPDVMKRDSVNSTVGFGPTDGDAADQSTRTARRSVLANLVSRMNPSKKNPPGFEGGIALADSEQVDLVDNPREAPHPQAMLTAFNQIITKPLLRKVPSNKTCNEEEDDEPHLKVDALSGHEGADRDSLMDSQSSIDPIVFKFDAADPSIAQFDPRKASENQNTHNSLSTIDRIHQRQTLRDRRTDVSRPHRRDGGLTESLHSSCSQVDALKAAQLSAERRSKDAGKEGHRRKSSRTRKSTRSADSSAMKDGSMKDISSATTSSNRSRDRRRRHTHMPSSPGKSPPTSPSANNLRHHELTNCTARSNEKEKNGACPQTGGT